MNIALDYDDTYTRAPELWDRFIADAIDLGHNVYIVTARDDRYDQIADAEDIDVNDIIYCRGVAKKWWCHHFPRIDFDIWIDDKPEAISENSPYDRNHLDEWRKNR